VREKEKFSVDIAL